MRRTLCNRVRNVGVGRLCSSVSRFQWGLPYSLFQTTHFPGLNDETWQLWNAQDRNVPYHCEAINEGFVWRLPPAPCYDWLLYFAANVKLLKKEMEEMKVSITDRKCPLKLNVTLFILYLYISCMFIYFRNILKPLGFIRSFRLSILFHHGSACSYITCGVNNRSVGDHNSGK
jgi:hypothetical protein